MKVKILGGQIKHTKKRVKPKTVKVKTKRKKGFTSYWRRDVHPIIIEAITK